MTTPIPEPHWTAYVTALVTPVVAVFAALIASLVAYRNWRTAQNKLKFDMFDKRVKVYTVLREAMQKLAMDKPLDAQELVNCYDAMFESEWLFSKDVYSYLLENTMPEIAGCRAMAKQVFELKVELLDPSGDMHTTSSEFEEAKRKLKEMVAGMNAAMVDMRAQFAPFLNLQH